MATTAADMGLSVFPSAILLSTFSLLVVILILPPLFWHARNRNVGATAAIAWMIILNLETFLNAIMWPNDNTTTWFGGQGLCDIEVKLQVASQVAAPATLGCVLRALARVMDTEKATLIQTKAQRMRGYAIDMLWCVGFPLLQMLAHYIVQPRRYYIFAISGCVPAVSSNWLTILLIYIPPLIWTIIDAYYAILILTRLYRYRSAFASILAGANTTKSRFLRLYLLCLTWILVFVPLQVIILTHHLSLANFSYTWADVHSPSAWAEILLVPSQGGVVYDRWIWLVCAFLLFVFFGLGKDALGMYRQTLLGIGLGRLFPGLNQEHVRHGGSRATRSMMRSLSNKVKSIFKRKTPTTNSSRSDSVLSGVTLVRSSTKMAVLQPISRDKALHPDIDNATQPSPGDFEKAASPPTAATTRLTSFFKHNKPSGYHNAPYDLDQLSLANRMTKQHATVHSDVSTSLPSPTTTASSTQHVLVRKEIRQGSEAAETLGAGFYHAA